MSSLPTHSTSGSVSAGAGPAAFLTAHCSLLGPAPHQGPPPNIPPWSGGGNLGPRYNNARESDGGSTAVANGDSGPRPPTEEPGPLTETGAGSRSPVNTDELLIERLEQRLLERESELQDLQVPAGASAGAQRGPPASRAPPIAPLKHPYSTPIAPPIAPL